MSETRLYIAPAKINLGLEILRRRDDADDGSSGYHELRTILYRVLEPHDVMRVTPSEFFRFTCSDVSLPTDERNLVMRAARLFADSYGLDLPPMHVHLEKRIPMGAGLGGGSSDAATMLRILKDAMFPPGATAQMDTSKIGADVPFFYSGAKAALATGIGEVLTPIEMDLASSILIVFDPTIHVSTREAYAGLDPKKFRTSELTAHPNLQRGGGVRNDFEPSIFASNQRLAMIKELMYDRGAHFSLMTGSGSAIFGLFADISLAREAQRRFVGEGLLAFLS